MQNLFIKSDIKGRFWFFFMATLGLITFVFLAFYFGDRAAEAKEAMTTCSYNGDTCYDVEDMFLGMSLLKWLCSGIAGAITVFVALITLQGGEFKTGKDGHWHTMTKYEHSLFGARSVYTTSFDEILDVYMHQSVFERWFNTGTVSVEVVKYFGPEYTSFTWVFGAVNDPQAVKEAILANAPASEGLSLHLRNSTED